MQIAMEMQMGEAEELKARKLIQEMVYAHSQQARDVHQMNAIRNDMRAECLTSTEIQTKRMLGQVMEMGKTVCLQH